MHKVAIIGLGYFSQFHIAAWQALPETRIVAVCDTDKERTRAEAARLDATGYVDAAEMLAVEAPDIVDIVTPPPSHEALVGAALAPGRVVVCQKPFCEDTWTARRLAQDADRTNTTLLIHENFRFQPWYREVRSLLDTGDLGAVWQARFSLKPGDGRGPRAYLDRQPAFQTMPRLMIHEVAVHFLDTFRWLLGPVESVYAETRKLNPVIAGEDEALVVMNHEGGARSVFDGNRLVDHAAENQRFTMGSFTLEAEAGVLRLDGAGRLWMRDFGETEEYAVPISMPVDHGAFGGGCVANTIAHIVEAMAGKRPFENIASDYVRVMELRDAAYASAAEGRRIAV